MSSSMFLLLALYICSAAADLEIAPYTVLKEHQGWEEREFPATKWISTDVFSINVQQSEESRAAFYRLFNYIDGQNSESMKIPMTAPVSLRIIPLERDLTVRATSRCLSISHLIFKKTLLFP